ncbi:MAG: hypothetical protein P8Y80_08295 [Acidobacteriota bacterium]
MLEGILKPFPDADLSVLVVWIVLKATDTPEAANEASAKFSDTRVTQFFDPGQMAGKAVAESLGHEGEVAWDFYLFYPPAVQWEELPPEPQAWMHQLPGGWADKEHLFKRKTLTKKLAGTMKSLFA